MRVVDASTTTSRQLAIGAAVDLGPPGAGRASGRRASSPQKRLEGQGEKLFACARALCSPHLLARLGGELVPLLSRFGIEQVHHAIAHSRKAAGVRRERERGDLPRKPLPWWEEMAREFQLHGGPLRRAPGRGQQKLAGARRRKGELWGRLPMFFPAAPPVKIEKHIFRSTHPPRSTRPPARPYYSLVSFRRDSDEIGERDLLSVGGGLPSTQLFPAPPTPCRG
jgi:hypothetical protein